MLPFFSSGDKAKKDEQGYGTMQPVDQPKQWESRASLFSLLLKIGSMWGKHMMICCFLIMGTVRNKSYNAMENRNQRMRLPKCVPDEPPYNMSLHGTYVCQYLTAWVEGFPAVVLAITCIFIARDLLQTRFFYGMLKRGCAIVYTGGDYPFKDRIVLYLLVTTGHIAAYMVFLFHVVLYSWVEEKGEALGERVYLGEASERKPTEGTLGRSELTVLVSVILLPVALILGQLYTDYNIAESLVPLTEFVHDELDDENEMQVSLQKGLTSLDVWKDCDAKPLFLERVNSIDEPALTLYDVYDKFIKLGLASPKVAKDVDVRLLQSLWPSCVLLRRRNEDKEATAFQMTFLGLYAAMLGLFVFIVWFLLDRIVFEQAEVIFTGNFHGMAAAAVHMVHMMFVSLVFVKISEAALKPLFRMPQI